MPHRWEVAVSSAIAGQPLILKLFGAEQTSHGPGSQFWSATRSRRLDFIREGTDRLPEINRTLPGGDVTCLFQRHSVRLRSRRGLD